MLCKTCDNITLKALQSAKGYKHAQSFYALEASAQGDLCSLCNLLWSAVKSRLDEDELDRDSFMPSPVRLHFDGMIKEFASQRAKKSRDPFVIHALLNSKRPATINIAYIKPSALGRDGYMLAAAGCVSLYRETSIPSFRAKTTC